MRRLGHKPVLAITAMVAAATAVTFAASPSVRADVEVHTGSVELNSLPSSAPVVLDQFDPALGTLGTLTVTASLSGTVHSLVENLSSVDNSSTLSFTADTDIVGPGAIALHVSIGDSATHNLPPEVPVNFDLADDGDQVSVITDPAVLALFSGNGTITFDLSGIIHTNVDGPANWRTRGVAQALATVTVAYEIANPCEETTTTTGPNGSTTTSSPGGSTTTVSPDCETTTTTSSTTTTVPPCEPPGPTTTESTLPGGSTTTVSTPPSCETTTTTLPETTTTTLPETTTTASTTTTSSSTTTTTLPCPYNPNLPPDSPDCVPPCDNYIEAYPGPTLDSGEQLLGGRLTINNVQYVGDGAVSFDWTSTVPIGSIDVESREGPYLRQHYGYPAGTTSGTGLHAPNNDPIKSLFVCLGPEPAAIAALTPAIDTASTEPNDSLAVVESSDADATTPTTEEAAATTEEVAPATEAPVASEPETGTTTVVAELPAGTPPTGTGV